MQAHKLRTLEEDFELAYNADDYGQCLAIIPEILSLARTLEQPERGARYERLRAGLEKSAKRQAEQTEKERAARAQIKEKLATAGRLEERWRYDQARAVYAEVKGRAAEIDDQLTIDYVDQQLAQVAEWEAEIASFDLSEFSIKPFKVLNTRRFDFHEVLPDERAANARLEELVAEGHAEGNVQVVTIVRRRFKGEGPFDDKGRCWAIYMRQF